MTRGIISTVEKYFHPQNQVKCLILMIILVEFLVPTHFHSFSEKNVFDFSFKYQLRLDS